MIEISNSDFQKEINSNDIVIVEFWGPKCGKCRSIAPEVEELAEKYTGQAKFVQFDSSKNRKFCLSIKVMSLPTFLFFKNGEEMSRLSGEVSVNAIESIIKKLI